jgi:hypothetical protein
LSEIINVYLVGGNFATTKAYLENKYANIKVNNKSNVFGSINTTYTSAQMPLMTLSTTFILLTFQIAERIIYDTRGAKILNKLCNSKFYQ